MVSGLKLRPLDHESSAFTTRPWLLASIKTYCSFQHFQKNLFFVIHKQFANTARKCIDQVYLSSTNWASMYWYFWCSFLSNPLVNHNCMNQFVLTHETSCYYSIFPFVMCFVSTYAQETSETFPTKLFQTFLCINDIFSSYLILLLM